MIYRACLLLPILFTTVYATAQFAQQIEEYVAPLVASNNFAGVILVEVGEDVIFEQSFGEADAETGVAHTIDNVFQIASVSKPFTASAIMLLVEEGKLSLDDQVARFVPDFNRGNELTIHHLLTHTSGIPNINGMHMYHLLEQQDNDLEGLISHFKGLPLEFEPGSKYGYSNSNYNLLAFIVEQASGMRFGDFLARRFFNPLNMEHTGHPGRHPAGQVEIVPGYAPEGTTGKRPARRINWTVKTGNGSLYSSVRDLHTWTRAFFAGEVVDVETRDLMLTEHIDHVGYGWFIRPRHGRVQYHINGRSPGYTAVISVYPDEDLTIIILSNNYIPVPTQMSIDIAGITLGESVKPLVAGTGKVVASVGRQVAGAYQFGPDFYRPNQLLTVDMKDGYLMIDWGVLLYRGGTEFINRNYWSEVKFIERDGQWVMMYDEFEGKRVVR